MSDELKGCPCCNGRGKLVKLNESLTAYAECVNCGLNIHSLTDEGAIKNWNNRTPVTGMAGNMVENGLGAISPSEAVSTAKPTLRLDVEECANALLDQVEIMRDAAQEGALAVLESVKQQAEKQGITILTEGELL